METRGEGVQGGKGGVQVNTDGSLAFGKEVREIMTAPVHFFLTTRQQLCVCVCVCMCPCT